MRAGRRVEWRVRPGGGAPEKFLDEGVRGDWIRQPGGEGTWIVTAGLRRNDSVESQSPLHLLDVERRSVVWTSSIDAGLGLTMPVFSSTGKSISAVFAETPDRSVVRIFDTATGVSRLAARLPFPAAFRANWVDDDRALTVDRLEGVQHIVMLDHVGSGPVH
jgi:hypothetical protein